jgi:glutamate/tyrosine decarboxylase-like PLP-dependent enzyme
MNGPTSSNFPPILIGPAAQRGNVPKTQSLDVVRRSIGCLNQKRTRLIAAHVYIHSEIRRLLTGRIRPELLPSVTGPAIVCIQAGNVNSGAFDSASDVIDWARRYNAWVHVDGAFGLWALASPDQASRARGFVEADSWAMDAHKWLNVPYDSGIAVVRDPEALERAMSISGAYLPIASDHRDAMNLTPDSSRRARAVEVWSALKLLGRSGLAQLVNRNCSQARKIADELSQAGIEVMNEVVLNQIVVSFGDDDKTRRVIASIQDSGRCWCGGTTWKGRPAMRISVSSWATTEEDVNLSIEAILDAHRFV